LAFDFHQFLLVFIMFDFVRFWWWGNWRWWPEKIDHTTVTLF